MKLHWFSPLRPADTDVAHYTIRLLPALAERADVVVWTTDESWDRAAERHAEVRRYAREHPPWGELNAGDVAFYNIGNHPRFHGSIWEVSRLHPGVVVLHDVRVAHLFAYHLQRSPARYRAAMARHHGMVGVAAAEAFLRGLLHPDAMAERFPLTAFALEGALGVMVHTREADSAARSAGHDLVEFAALPYPASPRPPRRYGDAPYRLIAFGHMGFNRRLEAVLDALAALPERDFRLDIYGHVPVAAALARRAGDLGLGAAVTIHGFVSSEALDAALDAADLAINLRFPTMGEASGSQLRIWDHALPSLVSAAGWYATLPADAVAFVRPDHEAADLQRHLADFVAGPARFSAMGEAGRRHLEREHDPRRYAEAVVELAGAARRRRAAAMALALVERTAAAMTTWCEPPLELAMVRRVAEQIHALAGGVTLRA